MHLLVLIFKHRLLFFQDLIWFKAQRYNRLRRDLARFILHILIIYYIMSEFETSNLCCESLIKAHVNAGSIERIAVLTQDVKEGQVIFENEPYMHCVSSSLRDYCCSLCLKKSSSPPSKALLRCSKCGIAHYCSAQHQVADWNNGHKHECKSLKALSAEGYGGAPLDDIMLLVRTVQKLLDEELNKELTGEDNDTDNETDRGIRCCSKDSRSGRVTCSASHVRQLSQGTGGAADLREELAVIVVAKATEILSLKNKKRVQTGEFRGISLLLNTTGY